MHSGNTKFCLALWLEGGVVGFLAMSLQDLKGLYSMSACNEAVSMSLQQMLNRVIPEEKQEPASS